MRAEHWQQLSEDGIQLKKWDPFERRALGARSPTHLGFQPFSLLWQGHTWSLLTLGVFLCPKAAAVLPSVGCEYFESPWQDFAALRNGTEGAHLGHSGRSGNWPRTVGLGADVCLHAVSSSAAGTPASDKSICLLSLSWQDNFAASGQHRWCVNFACCFCWWKRRKDSSFSFLYDGPAPKMHYSPN